jgi:hypothetical protein
MESHTGAACKLRPQPQLIMFGYELFLWYKTSRTTSLLTLHYLYSPNPRYTKLVSCKPEGVKAKGPTKHRAHFECMSAVGTMHFLKRTHNQRTDHLHC